jgi:DNA processing protein
MGWTTKQQPAQPVQTELIGLRDDLTPAQQLILSKLQEADEGLHINLLVMETQLPYSDVSSDLMLLELNGLIRSLPGGIYRFIR